VEKCYGRFDDDFVYFINNDTGGGQKIERKNKIKSQNFNFEQKKN
jgi:hypothetical protein